jgi:hypothetical protein
MIIDNLSAFTGGMLRKIFYFFVAFWLKWPITSLRMKLAIIVAGKVDDFNMIACSDNTQLHFKFTVGGRLYDRAGLCQVMYHIITKMC